MPRKIKRPIDLPASLDKYEARMRRLVSEDATFLQPLDDVWLGTFDIYGYISKSMMEMPLCEDCYSLRLFRVCEDHGVRPRGIITVRKTRNEDIIREVHEMGTTMPRCELPVVYVGRYSYFSGHEASAWGPLHCDRVLLDTTTQPATLNDEVAAGIETT